MDISCTVYAFSLRVFERVLFADCCNLSAKASVVNCKSVLADNRAGAKFYLPGDSGVF